MRSLITAIVAGSIGFAAARIAGLPFGAKQAAELEAAKTTLPLAPTLSEISPSSSAVPAPDPATSIPERLKAALRSRDPMEAAANVLRVLDSMTLDDFRNLGASPGRMPIPHLGSFDQEFCDGFMDVLIERWFKVDPSGAYAGIEELEKKLIIGPGRVWAGSGAFKAALARSNRRTLLDSLPENATWPRTDFSIPSAFTALAARDPAAARRYLARVTDPEARKSAEIAIGMGIAKRDPLEAVALSRTLGSAALFHTALAEAERIGPGMLRQVLAANDRKFPIGHSLTELVLRHPDEDWNAFIDPATNPQVGLSDRAQMEARRFSADAREKTLERLNQFPSAVRGSVAGALVEAWAFEQPQQATEWALIHAEDVGKGSPGTNPLTMALHRWMGADEPGAIAWWSQLPASAQRDHVGAAIATKLANDGKLDRALEIFQTHQGTRSAGLAEAIARARARMDPAAAATWLDSLPAELNTEIAISSVVQRWLSRDAEATARWVEAQPAGKRRDAALKAYTIAATERDPEAAAVWAKNIADHAMRAQAAEFVYREMNRRDPPAAREFLRSLPAADKPWGVHLIDL